MKSNTKVRVRTADLLAAVEAKRGTLLSQHKRRETMHEAAVARYRAAVVKALRERADKIEAGGPLPDTGYASDVRIKVPVAQPSKPHFDVGKIDRTIATLRIAADDAITITADDYAEYLG